MAECQNVELLWNVFHNSTPNRSNGVWANTVTQIWNNLPDSVLDVNNTNTFKNKQDKFWANESIKFNWRSPRPNRFRKLWL